MCLSWFPKTSDYALSILQEFSKSLHQCKKFTLLSSRDPELCCFEKVYIYVYYQSSLCPKKVWNKTEILQHDVFKTRRGSSDFIFHISVYYQGIARTQSPTNKNYAFELPTFVVIVGVSRTEVQWSGLALEEPPS